MGLFGPSTPASGYGQMSVPQAQKWLDALKRFRPNGTRGAMQRIGRYLREQHRDRLKRHVTPDGTPWAPTWSAPRPRVGEVAPMVVGPGPVPVIGPKDKLPSARTGRYPAVITARITNAAGRARAVAFRQRYGPPFKPEKALIRTAGKRKAKKIRDFLTRAGSGCIRLTATSIEYGYTKGTKWIEALHGGGKYREGSKRSAFRSLIRRFRGAAPVPARPIVGLNPENVNWILGYLADRYVEYARKEGVT